MIHSAPSTMIGLCALIHQRNAIHYRRRDGSISREHHNVRAVMDRWLAYTRDDAAPSKINRHQVRAWLDQLSASGLSTSYVGACLRKLRTCLRWTADLDYLPMSVLDELRLVRAPRSVNSTPARTIHPLDVIDLLVAALPPMPRLVLQLSRLTAARPSEILEATNRMIIIDSRPRLVPMQHKSAHHGHTRVIPLCSRAVQLIERVARPLCPDDYLLASPTRSSSGHYTIEAYRSAMRRACKRLGLPPIVPYDVRRAVAREVRSKCGLDAAQALLGHARASTTEIYAPLPPDAGPTWALALLAVEGLTAHQQRPERGAK